MSVTNSQFDPARIERIVREVLRRVTGTLTPGSNSTSTNSTVPYAAKPYSAKPSSTPPTSSAPYSANFNSANFNSANFNSANFNSANFNSANSDSTATNNSVLECSEKLIALQTLRGKLDNVTTLRVKPKTIVTPAVRDELRDRKINIVFDLMASSEIGSGPSTILLGTTCRSTGNSLKQQIGSNKQVQLHVDASASQLAKTIGDAISNSNNVPALIVTEQPYTAACIANRNANVRAVVVRDSSELANAKSELNPNCFVLPSNQIGQLNLSTILQQLT